MSDGASMIEHMFELGVVLNHQEAISRVRAVGQRRRIPVALEAVAAGWPSAAQDYFSGEIDLNEHLIDDPAATFLVRVVGDSMVNAGIFDGDELIVDRSLEPRSGDVVIALVDSEITVKRLRLGREGAVLQAENPQYADIVLSEQSDLVVWGVVTRCLHYVR